MRLQPIRAAGTKDYQVMLYRWAGGADPDRNVYQFFHSALLGSVLAPGQKLPEQEVLSGDLPSLLNPPSGCRFRTRCNCASEVCATTPPGRSTSSPTHLTACHHPHDPAQ